MFLDNSPRIASSIHRIGQFVPIAKWMKVMGAHFKGRLLWHASEKFAEPIPDAKAQELINGLRLKKTLLAIPPPSQSSVFFSPKPWSSRRSVRPSLVRTTPAEATGRVGLPAGCLHDGRDGRALFAVEHREHKGLL
jgi:hypothetical protein